MVRTFRKTGLFGDRSVPDNILIGLHLRSRQHPIAIILGLPSVTADQRGSARTPERSLDCCCSTSRCRE
jgi:ABC-type branched-subunit amino acid transport system ATPase component